MLMQGTIVNILAICCGCFVGRAIGKFLSEKVRSTLMTGLGLAVLLIGLQMALKSEQIMIVIGSLIGGAVLGEFFGIEKRLEDFGMRLQRRFSGSGTVAQAFVTASLIYCVGAMAIMGSIQDGLGGAPTILYAKSALDGIASVALTSALGIGVIFSIVPLALYQGAITLFAGFAKTILTEAVVLEMNSVGGLLILAIGLDLLGIRKLPVGNLLPGIFLVPLLIWLFA
jgi:uncharacterized membrane protein YqgA involved in biofilm formation